MARSNKTKAGFDLVLLIPVLILIGIGLVMVYSASSNVADFRLNDSYYYLKKQAFFCFLGLGLMVLATKIPVRLYGRLSYPLLGLSLVLLCMVLIPGIGHRVGGASRWIKISGFSFQPSELAKFSLAVYMAYSMAKKGSEMATVTKGLLPHFIVIGTFSAFILLQPDLGTVVILAIWAFILLFVGGSRLWHLSSIVLACVPLLILLITGSEYRVRRWWAFTDPWKDPTGIGFQIIHSFLAFGSGGILGTGLGNSKQKLFYLPEPHTDFIFSIIGEELGMIGVLAIVGLFAVIIVRGIQIALSAKDLYTSYLAFGLTLLIGLQVLVNMGVVMGLLPTKGLTLPFLSYGGSSLVIALFSVGILLNIASER